MAARMLYAHTLSPLHCGVGQSADVIDLPIARERVTNWPLIPSSSVKGPLKVRLRPSEQDRANGDFRVWRAAFGPDTDRADEGGGSLTFTDLHLLCFPVRSYAGTFAWVTSPLALRRWMRDHRTTGLPCDVPEPPPVATEELLVTDPSELVAAGPGQDGNVYLEDLDLRARHEPAVEAIAGAITRAVFEDADWRRLFMTRFAIAHDDTFTFLTETATEVVNRVRIAEESRTVERGALWLEEAAPAETIFAGPVQADRARDGVTPEQAVSRLPARVILQLGGHVSIGRGITALVVSEGLS